jgi:hypothetical protein
MFRYMVRCGMLKEIYELKNIAVVGVSKNDAYKEH